MSSCKWFVSLSVVTLLVGLMAVGCQSTIPPGNTAALAGQTKFNESCASCHLAATLVGHESQIVNDLGTVNSAMNGIQLTDEEIANLIAFLATQ
jgi:hypothetical protein